MPPEMLYLGLLVAAVLLLASALFYLWPQWEGKKRGARHRVRRAFYGETEED